MDRSADGEIAHVTGDHLWGHRRQSREPLAAGRRRTGQQGSQYESNRCYRKFHRRRQRRQPASHSACGEPTDGGQYEEQQDLADNSLPVGGAEQRSHGDDHSPAEQEASDTGGGETESGKPADVGPQRSDVGAASADQPGRADSAEPHAQRAVVQRAQRDADHEVAADTGVPAVGGDQHEASCDDDDHVGDERTCRGGCAAHQSRRTPCTERELHPDECSATRITADEQPTPASVLPPHLDDVGDEQRHPADRHRREADSGEPRSLVDAGHLAAHGEPGDDHRTDADEEEAVGDRADGDGPPGTVDLGPGLRRWRLDADAERDRSDGLVEIGRIDGDEAQDVPASWQLRQLRLQGEPAVGRDERQHLFVAGTQLQECHIARFEQHLLAEPQLSKIGTLGEHGAIRRIRAEQRGVRGDRRGRDDQEADEQAQERASPAPHATFPRDRRCTVLSRRWWRWLQLLQSLVARSPVGSLIQA